MSKGKFNACIVDTDDATSSFGADDSVTNKDEYFANIRKKYKDRGYFQRMISHSKMMNYRGVEFKITGKWAKEARNILEKIARKR